MQGEPIMKPFKFHHAAAVAAITGLSLLSSAAISATTVETSTQQAPPPPGKRMINLANFDLNKDGMLSTSEVGEMLFKIFDTDISGALDNAEYSNKSLLTVVPMEKETTISYDFNNDGIPDKTVTTAETFMQETQLAKFDTFKDGMSPEDFVGKSLTEVDTDGSGTVDLAEWRDAYMTRIAPAIAPAGGP
jgi:Ca2+-binding EF-hand superfamily protein